MKKMNVWKKERNYNKITFNYTFFHFDILLKLNNITIKYY